MKTYQFKDIGFFVEAKPFEYYCEFRVFEITGESMEGKPLFGDDFDEEYTNSRTYLEGSVKWDGCANFEFTEQSDGLIHTCGRGGMKDIGDMLLKLHDITAELVPYYDSKLAE
jgi:hypothetical protein